jgi:hypothetical protein
LRLVEQAIPKLAIDEWQRGNRSISCAVSLAYDLPVPEGPCQMVDEGANNRRQATARREDEMNDAVVGTPLREDMGQAALRQLASAGMFRQECHSEPSNRRFAKGEEINAGHARFVADRTLRAIGPGERPDHLAHLIGGGQRRQLGEHGHIVTGAQGSQSWRSDQDPARSAQAAHGQGSLGLKRRANADRDIYSLVDQTNRPIDGHNLQLCLRERPHEAAEGWRKRLDQTQRAATADGAAWLTNRLGHDGVGLLHVHHDHAAALVKGLPNLSDPETASRRASRLAIRRLSVDFGARIARPAAAKPPWATTSANRA